MIGIVIPAHNEEDRLAAAIAAAITAATHPLLDGRAVLIVVVADACTDRTVSVARAAGVAALEVDFRNVGRARQAGAEFALAHGAQWLACTDADSTVAPDWLVQQIGLNAEAVCGCVWVDDWSVHPEVAEHLASEFAAHYRHADGHSHIHGANLGCSAQAYRRSGGFQPLASDEDVAFVRALQKAGVSVMFSAAPRVVTSARADHRAPRGFGATVLQSAERLSAELANALVPRPRAA